MLRLLALVCSTLGLAPAGVIMACSAESGAEAGGRPSNGSGASGAGAGVPDGSGGGTPAASGAGGGGSAQAVSRDGRINDSPVTFDWPDVFGSGAGVGDCLAGRYEGTFECNYTGNGQNLLVTGPVAFTLQQSQDGEFLVISDGALEGVAMGAFSFTSSLSGELNCSTNELLAFAVNGTYGFGLLPLGAFDGGLAGLLDRASQTLSGEWTLTEGSGGTCIGPWSATRVP